MNSKKFDSTRLPLSHERLPRLEYTRILREGSIRQTGKDALHTNILVAKIMTEFVKSLLGPYRMSKIIQCEDGRYTLTFVTTDLKTILRKVKLQHPVAQLMAGAAVSVFKVKGDGSVSTIILAGKILEECEKLIDQGLHPNVVKEGLILSYKKAVEIAGELGFNPKIDVTETVKLQIHNALNGKLPYQDRENIAMLVSEAVKILNLKNLSISEGADVIDIKKIKGKSLRDSFLVDGLALYRELPNMNMPKRVENAKIALIKGELIIPKKFTKYYDHRFELNKLEQFHDFKREELKYLRSLTDRILDVGANVIMLEKGVDERILDYLARQNILLIRRFPPPEVDRTAKATGAFAVASIHDLDPSCLGFAKVVEHKKIGGEPWLLLWGCKNPKTIDIVLRGTSIYLLDDVERIIKGAILVAITLAKEPLLVFGGGAFEEEVALSLRRYASTIADKRQVVVSAVAKAFEGIPLLLAENAGMDQIDTLTELRAKHSKGEIFIGVDAVNRQLADMNKAKIFDSLAVKKAIMAAAFETALTVIQVDDYIKCKELPEPEKYYVQRTEKTKGMKIEEEV
ncbi:MAG: thermosome subunit beta [Candidatus Bathyarchaeia archaeon]